MATRSSSLSPRHSPIFIAALTSGIGIALIVIIGIIHFIDTPDSFSEATYKGVLFALNGLAAFAAAYGIARGERWGWLLGVLVAGGAFIMYIVSRTLGLPNLGVDDEWFEPVGILSLIVEASFCIFAVTWWLRRDSASNA